MINMISNRLKSLVKYVDTNDKAIDIGCDHALLDIYLVQNKIVNNIIVSDVSSNALEQGINNIKKYNLEDYIDARVGNGLEVLKDTDNVDTIIISGMGTNTILEILNNKYLYNVKKLIIQSNRDYYELRRDVVKLGFVIKEEEVIEDNGKIYINIVFIRGIKNYSLEELKYGTNNMVNKEIYYKSLIDKKNKILNCITDENLSNTLKEEIRFLKRKC